MAEVTAVDVSLDIAHKNRDSLLAHLQVVNFGRCISTNILVVMFPRIVFMYTFIVGRIASSRNFIVLLNSACPHPLQAKGIPFERFDHVPVHTVEEQVSLPPS